MAQRDIPKAYEPGAIEPRWAQQWVERKLYTPEVAAQQRAPDKSSFSLAIPPPNVTGSLHMGHMLEHTQIDILMRWRRMQGHRVLWLPGMDHAGIATQVVVERELAKQGLDRQQIGREEFERRVWEWKAHSGGTIKNQMVRLGASCDWTRERFTLEPALYRAVLEAFLRLYHEKLIYRGRYMINWCPRCLTALSDLEVEHQERDAKLYTIRYPLVGAEHSLSVATTRPETLLGDTAVAVHPEDERYRKFVGQKVLLPLMKREIPVLADEYVDREFGTGVVKITPGHDPNDFEVGRRHGLAEIEVMDDAARMNQNAGAYQGLDRFQARKRVLADLESQGLLEKVEPYRHAVGLCQRCKTLVEPRVSLQWFCKMKPLAEPAIQAVRDGLIKIVPENWEKVYLDWMERIHDWCISRQLWWGHRIPIWHCGDCGALTPARDSQVEVVNDRPQAASPPSECSQCGSGKLTQDADVLDTWFSSALWPFSTLGWPDQTPDLEAFYPTTLMINGFDILFFWDARMIMTGLHFLPQPKTEQRIPFHTLYIHALVRDADRQKMSKTRGNVVNPLEITERYGTDAVRFTLAIMAAPGTDISLSEDRLKSYRAFANKIWNAARFIFMNLDKAEEASGESAEQILSGKFPLEPTNGERSWPTEPDLADRWICTRVMEVARTVEEALAGFRFHEASHQLYHFFWHDFCDWYIEWVKPRLFSEAGQPNRIAFRNLLCVFEESLRLLHPFMPFITEELWQQLPHKYESIALAPFPQAGKVPDQWEKAAQEMALVQEGIVALRNIRAEMKIDARRRVPGELAATEESVIELFRSQQEVIVRLASLTELKLSPDSLPAEGGVLRHAARFDARVPFSPDDLAVEVKRLQREKEKLGRQLESARTKLANQQFLRKAPQEVVRGLEQRQAEYDTQYQKVSSLLSTLEHRLGTDSAPSAGESR
ncbi:MAG: valine--tRNA ligase [Acidobacteria bacterium]|nr:valine--tRNA ligase [Acidobacteriota bacterium]